MSPGRTRRAKVFRRRGTGSICDKSTKTYLKNQISFRRAAETSRLAACAPQIQKRRTPNIEHPTSKAETATARSRIRARENRNRLLVLGNSRQQWRPTRGPDRGS